MGQGPVSQRTAYQRHDLLLCPVTKMEAPVDRREAFCAAVIKFQLPEWSPAFPDNDTFEVDGEYRTIRRICELVRDDTAELPDETVGHLMQAMLGDRRLLKLLGPSRTYATGSQCLSELLEYRVRTFQAKP
jgi:hypothetical protein